MAKKDILRGEPRPNTPLIAMVMVGAVATVGGAVVAVVAATRLQTALFQAAALLNVGIVAAGFGVILLTAAWIIAAAKWPSRYE